MALKKYALRQILDEIIKSKEEKTNETGYISG